MIGKEKFALAAFLASVVVLPLNAQRVLLLPGTGSTVDTFTVEPFAAATPLGGASRAFAVIPHPSGNRYFIVTPSNVVVADESGISVQTPVSVGLPIMAAALTPDGGKLLVTAGTASSGSLYIFDVSGSTMTQTGVVTVGGNAASVAASMDSALGFVLTPEGLTSVDLGANTAGKPVYLGKTNIFSSKVVVGPNGLLYVNADQTLYEINGYDMTIRKAIAVEAFPYPPTFTPDGATALLANPAGGDLGSPEAGLLTLDLKTYTVKNTARLPGTRFVKLIPTNAKADTLYAVASEYGGLFQMHNDLSGVVAASFPVVGTIDRVLSAFTSSELPNTSGVTGARYLFVVSQTALYRIDLNPPAGATDAQITKSIPLSLPSPSGIYFAPPSTGSRVASTLRYGDGQTVAKGGFSAPLVVRAVDSLGRPISGVKVAFACATGTIVSSMAATNTEGFAQAIVKVPDYSTSFSVNLSVEGVAAGSFSIGVGTVDGGGEEPGPTPMPDAAGISILSGNGQVMRGDAEAVEPLVVKVIGENGGPVEGAVVTFKRTDPGAGSISGDGCTIQDVQTLTCKTDAGGLASVTFSAPTWQMGPPVHTTLTASVKGATGVPDQTVTFHETWVGSSGALQAQQFLTPTSTGVTITAQAGQTRKGAIRTMVFDQTFAPGTPIPNVGLMVRGTKLYDPTKTSPAYCDGRIVLSGGDGVVTCDLVVPSTTPAGTYPIYAVFGGNSAAPFTLQVTSDQTTPPVATTVAIISGNPQSGSLGQTLQPLVVVVKDQFGNAMPNTAVTWTVTGPAQLKAPTSTTTGTDGRASTGVALGSTPGAATVRVTAGTVSATFNLTAIVSIGNVAKGTGDGQTAVVGGQFAPVSVKVTDSQGSPISGVSVEFKVTSGAATPSTKTVSTDASGVAAATFTATNTPSQIVVTASAGGQSVTFNLASRLPGPVLTAASFLNGASMEPGVAFGSIIAIKGEGLTTGLTIPPGTCLSAVPDGNLERGLPTRLAGIEVWFSSQIAPIFAICKNADGSEQVNVQAPFELAPATIYAVVKTGIGTAMETATVVSGVVVTNALPGIFEYNLTDGTRAAVALRPDGTVVSPTNKAKRGEVIRLFATGLGPVLPVGSVAVKTNQPGYPGQMPFFVTSVQLAGAGTAGVTAEYAQNLIGVFIVTFQVPDNAPSGNSVALNISVLADGQNVSSKASSIPIE